MHVICIVAAFLSLLKQVTRENCCDENRHRNEVNLHVHGDVKRKEIGIQFYDLIIIIFAQRPATSCSWEILGVN